MKLFEKIDIGFWFGLLALAVGVVWIILGIVFSNELFIYPFVLLIFGLWAVIRFEAGSLKKKKSEEEALDEWNEKD
ncbi:MAG: hypothetical protein MI810_10420 [Flavobacteriales bacterium]|nr:hypothetical protein [Flavobacteriales bacterium]